LHVYRFVFSYLFACLQLMSKFNGTLLLPACYINRDVLHQLPG
jgi:hypothetical protein